MEIRLAREEDAEQIRQIYNLEVVESTVTFDLVARSEDAHRAWMREHRGAYPVIVATDDDVRSARGKVLGFASLSPYRPRPAYSTTVEDSVYVCRDVRGRGVGKALLAEIVQLATTHGFHSVIARIVGDHEASINLHLGCGFSHVGIEHEVGRKFGRWLDVAVMQSLLSNDPGALESGR